MGKRSATVVDAVRAMYAVDGRTDDAWLKDVLVSLQGCVPGTVGGFAYTYEISGAPLSWHISRPIVHEAPPSMADHIYQSFLDSSPEARAAVLPRLGPSGTFSAVTGRLLSTFGEREASSLGVLDAIHVNALDADDRGVLVSLTTPARRRLTPAERSRLAMFAAHLAGARRWRAAARATEPDIRFEANGAVAHVESGHEAYVDRLRGRLLRLARVRAEAASPDQVLAAWSALVDGRYTILDRFDTDGRRYVVAHENPPNVRDPRGLTQTEAAVASWARRGHAQKLIAYELGLSLGTVSGLLGRVFAKLGVKTRAELVERLESASKASRVAVGETSVLLFEKGGSDLPLDPSGVLTDSERDVAMRAFAGESNAVIAAARGSSVSTVKNQLSSLFRKLGVSSRAELVALAHRTTRQP